MHELDRRAAQWIAQRVEPAARVLTRVGSMLRWARQWPWYAVGLYAFGVASFAPISEGDAIVTSWAGMLCVSAGVLVSLKK